jgi:pyruvate,water dikinase
MGQPLVILPRELGATPPSLGLVGQKARGLSQLLTLKARVPRFGVVTVAAFDAFVSTPELRVKTLEAERQSIHDDATLIAVGEALTREALATPLPDDVLEDIAELKRSFADDDAFAVRASVAGDDLEVRALAGALDAALATRDVEGCVQRLFALAFHPRTLRARLAAGLSPLGTRVAVVVQRFVAAEQSGVCLSFDIDDTDDVAQKPRAVIRSCFGLAGGIGGRAGNDRITCDTHMVLRPAIAEDGLADDARVTTSIERKSDALRDSGDGRLGTRMFPLDEVQSKASSLSVVQSRLVAKEAIRLEAALGKPQVMSFAFAGRLLHILDIEPLLVAQKRVESARVRVWDERLVPAALAQPTSTLSFSVWQRGVARGVERAARHFGVRGVVLEELRPQFRRALGVVTGRMTGNVDVFGALLDLLPFAEKARVALAASSLQPELAARTDGHVFQASAGRSGKSLWERAREKIDESRWPGQLERLAAVADGEGQAMIQTASAAALEVMAKDTAAADPDSLMDALDALEEHLSRCVGALAMSGVVCSLAMQLVDEELSALGLAALKHDLLLPDDVDRGERPALDDLLMATRRMQAIVGLIDKDPEMRSVCHDGDSDALADALRADPGFASLRQALADFVDAMPPEGVLLLEEPRLAERPQRLVSMVVRSWRSPRTDVAARTRDAVGRRKKADYTLEAALNALPTLQTSSARKRVSAALSMARHHGDLFARAWLPVERVVAALRRVSLALGERLFEHGLLEQPKDVFFLQDAEIAGVIRGSGPDVDVRPLVVARRRAAATRPPAMSRRTETRGVVATSLFSDDDNDEVVTAPGAARAITAIGAGTGVAEGAVCVADRGADAESAVSGVVVLGRANVFDMPLLCVASAVVIEGGNAMSPCCAALRQLSIPVVVQASSATVAFQDAEAVHVDGVSGVVRRIAHLSQAERPVLAPVVPAEQFLREAIATDPSGRPTRQAPHPAGISSEMPAPPAAGIFDMPKVMHGGHPMSDEGAPVDDADVVDEQPADASSSSSSSPAAASPPPAFEIDKPFGPGPK